MGKDFLNIQNNLDINSLYYFKIFFRNGGIYSLARIPGLVARSSYFRKINNLKHTIFYIVTYYIK